MNVDAAECNSNAVTAQVEKVGGLRKGRKEVALKSYSSAEVRKTPKEPHSANSSQVGNRTSVRWVPERRRYHEITAVDIKILRKIFGPIQENNTWRILNNREPRDIYRDPDIIALIRSRRLRWLGHVLRRDEDSLLRKAFDYSPRCTRPLGRPRLRWQDQVYDNLSTVGGRQEDAENMTNGDISIIEVKSWKTAANGVDPKNAVEEAVLYLKVDNLIHLIQLLHDKNVKSNRMQITGVVGDVDTCHGNHSSEIGIVTERNCVARSLHAEYSLTDFPLELAPDWPATSNPQEGPSEGPTPKPRAERSPVPKPTAEKSPNGPPPSSEASSHDSSEGKRSNRRKPIPTKVSGSTPASPTSPTPSNTTAQGPKTRTYRLDIQTPRQFWAHTTKTTTLTFPTIDDAEKFARAIPLYNYGPSAEISITPPTETRQKQTRNKEISVVMKNVDTLISEDELMQILAVTHPGITRIKRIISAQTDKPTNLVRIFTKDITTADKLLEGIKLAGRYYRVEPSHETIFHRPCLNCAQYGHTRTNCDKPKTCFKCGKNPDLCNHNRLSQIRYCATCNSDTHYTGQARCPKYPRTNLITSTDPTHVPIDTHKPIPKPIPKPSQSVFKPTLPKPELSYADAAKTTTTKTNTTDDPQTEKTTTEQLVEGVLRSAMQKIESYIDRQLNRLQDEIVTFTISLLTTDTNPTKRHTTLATANQAARRLLRKRVAHHFVGNRLRVSLEPLQKRD
ncbi:hypothetical protein ANN_24362 [Periplaneta americana]|uniref:CCHC-type domain-containing protein n=1 Tax=Periplaneta americana TaxID=6978 RepID=A0ABQ8S343_PERAM|nr:hypothetical protein ANN_24362 [Periplaneta americana]